MTVKMPVDASPARVADRRMPSKPAEITTSIASVVKVVLPEWTGTDRVNIVLLGIDKRDDEPISGTRSDTIMLVSIDPVIEVGRAGIPAARPVGVDPGLRSATDQRRALPSADPT